MHPHHPAFSIYKKWFYIKLNYLFYNILLYSKAARVCESQEHSSVLCAHDIGLRQHEGLVEVQGVAMEAGYRRHPEEHR